LRLAAWDEEVCELAGRAITTISGDSILDRFKNIKKLALKPHLRHGLKP